MKTIIVCFTIISLGFSQDLITVINSKYDNGNPKEEIIRKVIDDYNQPIVKKIIYCENGNLSEVTEYKDELINGLYQKFGSCWDETHYLETQINYELGKKNGLEQHFCENGQKSYEVNYFMDIKNGIERKWECNAMLTSKIEYSEGLIIGQTYIYSEDYDYDIDVSTYTKKYKNYTDGLWDCIVHIVEVLSNDDENGESVCYDQIYPTIYIMPDNSKLTINNQEELKNLKAWYENNPDPEIWDLIHYPVDFVMPDNSKLTINSQEGLQKVRDWYDKNGHSRDDPIQYPVHLTLPDNSTITANSKKDLKLADNYYSNIKPRLNYPVEIVYATNVSDTIVNVNSKNEMDKAIQDCLSYNNGENDHRQILKKYSGHYAKKTEKQIKDEKYDPEDYGIYRKDYFDSPDYYCDSRQYTRYSSSRGGELIIDGLFESWHNNGNKYQSINYSNNKYHGIFQQWHNNGEIHLTINYSEHSLDGEYQSWYKNGQKQSNANYSSGILDGSYKYWYDNGTKKRESFFVLGEFDSLDTKWSNDGTILYEKNYTMGNLLDYKIYSTNGSILIDQSIARTSNE